MKTHVRYLPYPGLVTSHNSSTPSQAGSGDARPAPPAIHKKEIAGAAAMAGAKMRVLVTRLRSTIWEWCLAISFQMIDRSRTTSLNFVYQERMLSKVTAM